MSGASFAEGKSPFGGFPSGSLSVWVLKLLVLGLIDVLAIWAIVKAYDANWWPAAIFIGIIVLAMNIVYFQKGALPWKYLLPGLTFLVAFQLYPAGYTFFISFTNYGTGHLIQQDQAVAAIISQNTRPVADSPSVNVRPLEQGGEVFMLITDPETGEAFIGSATELEPR